VIRSDVGVTHRLSSSAQVVSAVDRQVKTKRQGKKRLRHWGIRHAREVWRMPKSRASTVVTANLVSVPSAPSAAAFGEMVPNQLNVNITRII